MAYISKDPTLEAIRNMAREFTHDLQEITHTDAIVEEIINGIGGTTEQQAYAYHQIFEHIRDSDDQYRTWLLSDPRINHFVSTEILDRLSDSNFENTSDVLNLLSLIVSINDNELNHQFLLSATIKRLVTQRIHDISQKRGLNQGYSNAMNFLGEVLNSKNSDLIDSFLLDMDTKSFLKKGINIFLAEPKWRTFVMDDCILPIVELNRDEFTLLLNSPFVQDYYYSHCFGVDEVTQTSEKQSSKFNQYLRPLYQLWTKDQSNFNHLMNLPECRACIISEIKSHLVSNSQHGWNETYDFIKPILKSQGELRTDLLKDSVFLSLIKLSVDELVRSSKIDQTIEAIELLVVPILENQLPFEKHDPFHLPDPMLLKKIRLDPTITAQLSPNALKILTDWEKKEKEFYTKPLLLKEKIKPPIWQKMTDALNSPERRAQIKSNENRNRQLNNRKLSL